MPTTEERLTTLETAVADAQAEIIKRPTTDTVAALEAARDETADAQATTNTDVADRLSKLERGIAIVNQLFGSVYKKNADDLLAEDIEFSANKGPVIKSPNGTQYRIVVSNGGALTATAI